MQIIRYTLLADGRSDQSLQSIIGWVIEQHFPHLRLQAAFAFDHMPPISAGLRKRVEAAAKLYGGDVLFVHRDAERDGYDVRLAELDAALLDIPVIYVPVIPVRMTEAWLLGDEGAIRRAAENPRGRMALQLPAKERWESLPDPKAILFEALHRAADRPARRPIDEHRCRSRVADLSVNGFAHLRALDSFCHFEDAVIRVFSQLDGR